MLGRRKNLWRIGFVAGSLFAVAALVASVSAAPSGITWNMRRTSVPGTYSSKAFFRANVSQAIDVANDGVDTWVSSIQYADNDVVGGTGYAWPYCANGKPLPPAQCPYSVGVYYARSSNATAVMPTWTDFTRLNPEDQDGERLSIATDGANVYAVWASQPEYYTSNVGKGPRVLEVRVNTNYGAPANWGAMQALTDAAGRIDYPALAVANGRTYIAYTDSNTGQIHVATSTDGGTIWANQIIAKSKATIKGPYPYGASGYGARPAIGVSDDGLTVVVAYLVLDKAGNPTQIMARASLDGGATWDVATKLMGKADAKVPAPTASGGTDRVGIAFANKAGTKGYVMEYHKVGGWQPKVQFAAMPDTMAVPHLGIYTTGVGLQGASTIGVAYGGCYDSPCKNYKGKGIALLWTESHDGGVTWTDPEIVSEGGEDGSYNFSGYQATVVWDGTTTRYVGWQGLNKNWWNYLHGFRAGTTP